MLGLASLFWVIGGTAAAGGLMLLAMVMPATGYEDGLRLLPYAAAMGYLVAIPVAAALARRMTAQRIPLPDGQ